MHVLVFILVVFILVVFILVFILVLAVLVVFVFVLVHIVLVVFSRTRTRTCNNSFHYSIRILIRIPVSATRRALSLRRASSLPANTTVAGR